MTSPFHFLFPSRPFIDLPKDFFGFLVWFVYLFLIILLIKRIWHPLPKRNINNLLFFYLLAFLAPISIIIGGIEVGLANSSIIILLFSAIPWQVAAGYFGIIPAAIIGLISGIAISLWGSHSIFVILESVGMAILFSILVRQNYRTKFFELLRIPLFSAIFTAVIFFPIIIFNQAITIDGPLAARIDYSLSQTFLATLFRLVEIIFGGFLCSILFFIKRFKWQIPSYFVPTPMEKKIEHRFLITTLPIILFMLIFVMFVDWKVAHNAASELIETRLQGSAEVASASLPYFFESGQNLIKNIADELDFEDTISLQGNLSAKAQTIPFFTQMIVFDRDGNQIATYPDQDFLRAGLSQEELFGINLAITGVNFQIYAIPPTDEGSIQISFISSISDAQNNVKGVLLGRTDFNSNPYVQPSLSSFNFEEPYDSESFILDDQNRIIYHSDQNSTMVWTKFENLPANQGLFESNSADGMKKQYFYQPLANRSWSVIVGLPNSAVQELALNIAAPLMWVLVIVVFLVTIALRVGIHPITKTLNNLTRQAKLISQGELEHSIHVDSVDEIGQLAFSFEQMRMRLRDRLDELKQLLFASQGVSKHLDIHTSIQPILQTTLKEDVYSARVVLIKQVTADLIPSAFLAIGIGKETEATKALDRQLFEMMRYQDILPIQNLARFKRFVIPGKDIPGSILSIALQQEDQYYGVFWVAYKNPQVFKEEEIQFLKTIASQTAMAAANAQLYATAELGRQRFEAVLNSTPDPVMVFNEENRLILINPAARQLGGLFKETQVGLTIDEVIENEQLLELLKKDTTNRDTSREIYLSNRRVFFTTVSSVIRNDQSVGKVCLLRDITQYKEVDTFKSDIVSMVSHDLRSPLTLMRGYASMLQMVGEINEQQRSYIAKIVSGVDSMSRLVNNLLDLGRIDAGIGLKVEKTSPISLAEQVVYELQPHANQKNIELRLEYDLDRDLLIEADSALAQQALYNIVENALKYNSLGGKVKVNISSKTDHILYEISDNGIGIAPIDLPHLFEKFYRSGRREAYNQRGTGLGLAIVKSIIEKHNGKVWVESKLGRGSSFFIELPIKQS
ncbi:MAG TPA: ATP-binding protein [Anaerolineaceae bacterium]|nr:ATP-binding protein [Anaerolineaceae bacterium]